MDEREEILRLRAEALARHRRLMAESRELVAKVTQQAEHLRWLVSSIKRQWEANFHQSLQTAIRRTHGCESRHAEGFAVRKVAGREILWEGMVEEFDLIGHATAPQCYAWHYQEYGRQQSFSILKLPPIDTPQRAVQFFLLAREANLVHTNWLQSAPPPPEAQAKVAKFRDDP